MTIAERGFGPPQIVETHVSTLFFVGDRVYKLKKQVRTGFLDFTTRTARHAACVREVELNRRLAPDVYLGVATVVDEAGEPQDHLVVMRRMPEGRRLSTLVVEGQDVADPLRELARDLATFHARAPTGGPVDEAARADAVLSVWESSLAEMERFVGPVLALEEFAAIAAIARGYVEGRGALFDRRIAAGWARDGHGDLQADDIFCLPDGVRVLDCIEFDDRLRFGDVLADVAFLVMDLERLGRPELGVQFLRWYDEFSGERHATTLAEHYVAARAHVRAKVACLRYEQGHEESAAEARRLHAMARHHLEAAQVPLVIVGGLPGTGKSTLASRIADARGWAVLRSDEVRKELAGLSAETPAPAPFRAGLYTLERTQATYDALIERARSMLELGEPVVLDASWADSSHREAARHAARLAHSPVIELKCQAPLDVAMRRAQRRRAGGKGPSDADATVVRAASGQFHTWPEATVVDATLPEASVTISALIAIKGALSAGARGGGADEGPGLSAVAR